MNWFVRFYAVVISLEHVDVAVFQAELLWYAFWTCYTHKYFVYRFLHLISKSGISTCVCWFWYSFHSNSLNLNINRRLDIFQMKCAPVRSVARWVFGLARLYGYWPFSSKVSTINLLNPIKMTIRDWLRQIVIIWLLSLFLWEAAVPRTVRRLWFT